MDTETHDDKFSSVEDTMIEEWYVEMEKFIHYLAGRNANMAVEYDDIVGELLVELVKGVQTYPNLPHNQLAAVLRRMFDNRISELRYRYHVTHRKEALFDISLSIEVSAHDIHHVSGLPSGGADTYPLEDIIPGGDDPAAVYASKERVVELRDKLSDPAKAVFDSLIAGNNMLAMIVWLSSIRASAVFGSRTVRIKPWHIADALHMDEKEVKAAISEIKRTYRSYNDEY